jgi:hydroxymethylglutaryl-CoA lyase/(R)-citramalyl-CoA lyase
VLSAKATSGVSGTEGVPSSATICEVGPRDGLQNAAVTLAPAVRAGLVDRLAATGLAAIEAVSFVNPERVPQMAGAEEVLDAVSRSGAPRLAALVLNRKGFDRAVAAGVDEIHFSFAATEAFNRANANASVAEGVAAATEIVGAAHGHGLTATVTIGTAFGCPFEGRVDPARVVELAAQVAESRPREIALADTIGVAVPGQVARLARRAAGIGPPIGLHLHDTRGTGIANAWAGLEAGIGSFDASVGGIGGCPFAPGAAGNIATEDLVYLLEGEGVATGVDLDRLIAVARWLEGVLGRELPGSVYRAGGFPASAHPPAAGARATSA